LTARATTGRPPAGFASGAAPEKAHVSHSLHAQSRLEMRHLPLPPTF
jgi:hypothetical protein